MKSLSADLKWGLSREAIIIEKLKKHFKDDNIIKTDNPYCIHDAIGEKTYEIKSRRVNKNAYPTTIIPVNKIADIFVFNFLDQTCYIPFDEKFDKYEKKIQYYERQGSDSNRGLHYHIPIDDLIDF